MYADSRSHFHSTRRKECEVRRYFGKDSVEEYLAQFELIASRNGWTDQDEAFSLFSALDGNATELMVKFDDRKRAKYKDIKQTLLKRFSSSDLVQIYEKALSNVKLSKGQSVI